MLGRSRGGVASVSENISATVNQLIELLTTMRDAHDCGDVEVIFADGHGCCTPAAIEVGGTYQPPLSALGGEGKPVDRPVIVLRENGLWQ